MSKKFRDVGFDFDRVKHVLNCKYYNLYKSNFDWTGLNYRQRDFIMKELWARGTVACFKIKNIDELGFAPWVRSSWDMYGCEESVNLVNQYGSPLVPSKELVVDKEVVLGWLQSNHKPLKVIADWYIERIAQVECVINTNLQLQKIPFIIPVEPDSKKKLEDIVDRILNNEIVITVESDDWAVLKSIQLEAPYLIDKLVNYKKDLENELKTFFGVQNNGVNKIEQLQLSEVNANNGEIMSHDNDFENMLNEFCDRIYETFGKAIGVKIKNKEYVQDEGVEKEYEDVPGPEEGNKND